MENSSNKSFWKTALAFASLVVLVGLVLSLRIQLQRGDAQARDISTQAVQIHELQREMTAQKNAYSNDRALFENTMNTARATVNNMQRQVSHWQHLATEAREAYNACR